MDDAVVCMKCGCSAAPAAYNAKPSEPKTRNTMGIISMICGIASIVVEYLLVCCCWPLGIFLTFALSIIAIVLAVKTKKSLGKFSGMAIAGLITGLLGLGSGIISLIIVILYLALYGGTALLGMFAGSL